MKKLLALAALLVPFAVQGATYYISDCAAGAVPGCVQGNDASLTPTNPATPWRSVAKAFDKFRNANPGDRIFFAKGGAFISNLDTTLQNTSAVASNPIVLGAYQPSWYAGAQKPIISYTGTETLLSFSDGGSPEPDGGYVVRDLHLKGNLNINEWQVGIFTSALTSDILFYNLTIDGFRIGVYCGNNIPRIRLRESRLINNKAAGTLWGCQDSLIENNIFDNNGYGHAFLDHQIYLDSGPDPVPNVTLRNNKLTRSVHFNGDRCTGAPIVGHGRYVNLLIEKNQIIETKAAGLGCWGIALDSGKDLAEGGPEYFRAVTIRSNLLVNVGNMGIGCTSCDRFLIENNVLIYENPVDDHTAISIPDKDLASVSEDLPITRVNVRNNSIHFQRPGNGNIAIRIAEQGSGHVITSNLILFGGTTPRTNYCFNTAGLGIADFLSISNNLCYGPGARFNQTYNTQLLAQNANPLWNVEGVVTAPLLAQFPTPANNYSMATRAGSPAVNAGNQARCVLRDYFGALREARCDIGAYEYYAP